MNERYVIHVTKACNMKCAYCYEQDKTSKYKTEEVVETARTIAKNCPAEEFGIEFLGGEPMLAFDTIKAVYEMLEKEFPGRVADYIITTNGTILNDEILEYLKANPKLYFAVSMDGTKWANQLRVMKDGTNSFDIVKANILKAIEVLSCEQVGVHIVTHPYNVGSIQNSIQCLYDMGIRSIGVGTIESTIRLTQEYCNRFIAELLEVSKKIKAGKYPGLLIDLFNSFKPESDKRHYIKDPVTGKTIGETYGRVEDDITEKDVDGFESIEVHSPVEEIILDIRRCVFENHWNIMEGNEDG